MPRPGYWCQFAQALFRRFPILYRPNRLPRFKRFPGQLEGFFKTCHHYSCALAPQRVPRREVQFWGILLNRLMCWNCPPQSGNSTQCPTKACRAAVRTRSWQRNAACTSVAFWHPMCPAAILTSSSGYGLPVVEAYRLGIRLYAHEIARNTEGIKTPHVLRIAQTRASLIAIVPRGPASAACNTIFCLFKALIVLKKIHQKLEKQRLSPWPARDQIVLRTHGICELNRANSYPSVKAARTQTSTKRPNELAPCSVRIQSTASFGQTFKSHDLQSKGNNMRTKRGAPPLRTAC